MTAVVARIILRYASAALVTYGVISVEAGQAIGADADVAMFLEMAIGAVLGIATEGWYYIAKRDGGAT
jgi:hypothetical protein